MKIKLMTIEDYDDVYGLWTAEAGVGLRSIDDSIVGIDKFIKRNPNTNFVAQVDGKIIAAILCGNDGRRAYIYHAIVSKGFRKRGIAKSLVDATIVALKIEGIHKMALVVFADNSLGNSFWLGQGFVRRHDLFYWDLSLNEENV